MIPHAIIAHTHAEAAVVLSAALIALVILAVAFRGRKVDDHPHCRRCGFDLFMKPPTATRCPECGASLSTRKSIRRGKRQIQSRPFSIALLVLLICAADGAIHGYRRAKIVVWIQYAPNWWLDRQAESKRADSRDTALAELTRRIKAGILSPQRESALVTKALAYQADQNHPWVPGWGDIVQATFECGRLTPRLWDQYELNALQLHLEPVAGTMRSCDPVMFRVIHGPDRVGNSIVDEEDEFVAYLFFDRQFTHDATTRRADFEGSLRGWTVDQPPDEGALSCTHYLVELDNSHRAIIDPDVTPHFDTDPTNGLHHAQISLNVRAARYNESRPKAHFHGSPRTITMDCHWIMASSPQVSTDPSLRAAVLNSLNVTGFQYDGLSLDFTLGFKPPPIDLAYRVFAHVPSDNADHFLTSFYLARGQPFHLTARFEGKFYKDDKISLRFIADPHLTPLGATQLWGEGISIDKDSPARPFTDRQRWTTYGFVHRVYMNP